MKSLQIFNVRLGFASNSSSTHSLIFIRDKKIKDHLVCGHNFFVDGFFLTSKEAKIAYLAIMLKSALQNVMCEDYSEIVTESLVGTNIFSERKHGEDLGIDHASIYAFPLTSDGTAINKAFFEDFKAFWLQPGLAVFGDGDNSHIDPDVLALVDKEPTFSIDSPQDTKSKFLVARKDEKLGYWSIFNKQSGAKVRMSFEQAGKNVDVDKSTYPELVDLNITDFCDEGCAYCYKDSTTQGQHAEIDNIEGIVDVLAKMEVFEVALGGGDVMAHPRFLDIIKGLSINGIIPNFTTKNIRWLTDIELYTPIFEHIGSFAYSVTKERDVHALAALLSVNNLPFEKAAIQVIIGADPYNNSLKRILAAADIHGFSVTLLGFKTTGRGKAFSDKKKLDGRKNNWIDIVNGLLVDGRLPSLGVDTLLAKQYEAEIAEMVPDVLYQTEEGKFSCYIDAVDMTIGASSYVDHSEMSRLGFVGSTSIYEQDKLEARVEEVAAIYEKF